MAVSTSKPKIIFQTADDATFAGATTEEFNISAVPLGVEAEELMRCASGERIHSLIWSFEIQFLPFSTKPQTTDHDSSDKIRLVNMLAKKYLKVQSITQLSRYTTGGIAEAKALLENQRVSFNGTFSTSLESEKAVETVSVGFTRLQPIF